MKALLQFFKDEEGATAIEYGLIAALIALGIIAGASFLGNTLSNAFNSIGNTLNSAAN